MPQTVTVTGSHANEISLAELDVGPVAFITRTTCPSLVPSDLVGAAVVKAAGSATILRWGVRMHSGFIAQENAGGVYVPPLRPGEQITIEGV